jgi:hypothetical protein
MLQVLQADTLPLKSSSPRPAHLYGERSSWRCSMRQVRMVAATASCTTVSFSSRSGAYSPGVR